MKTKSETPGLRGLADEIKAMSPARRLRFAADLLEAARSSERDPARARGFMGTAGTILRGVLGELTLAEREADRRAAEPLERDT